MDLNNFAYRGDYGGGGNHPRTFTLEGSNDGLSWSKLSEHSEVKWNGSKAKNWGVK